MIKVSYFLVSINAILTNAKHKSHSPTVLTLIVTLAYLSFTVCFNRTHHVQSVDRPHSMLEFVFDAFIQGPLQETGTL